MKTFLFKPIVAILIVTMVVHSCSLNMDDYDFDKLAEVKWNPEYALPLVYGSLSIGNLLSKHDSLALRQKEDGLLYFEYEEILESRNLNEIIIVPDHSFVKSYSVASPVIVPVNGSHIAFNNQETIDLRSNPELEHEELTEAFLKAGIIQYRLENPGKSDADVEISFPTIKNGQGQMLIITLSLIKGSTAPVMGYASLNGYYMDFSTLEPAYNQFPMIFKMVVKGGSSGTTISPLDDYDLNVDFLDQDYHFIRGYFGKQTVELDEDYVKIGSLADVGGAEISIVGAVIDLEVINGYRIPGEVTFRYFEARQDVETMDIVTDPVTPMHINSPTEPDKTASTLVSITNASDVFNFRPDGLYYQALATINPTDVYVENFIKDSDRLKLRLRAEAPLYGWAKGIELMDTIEISIGEDLDHNVESALMKFDIKNEFPLEASLQVYFTDENYEILDSMFIDSEQMNIIKSSTVDNSGYLKPGGEGIYDKVITLNSNRFSNFLKASYLILKTQMNTTNLGQTNVKFTSGYKMHINIGIQTKLELSLKP